MSKLKLISFISDLITENAKKSVGCSKFPKKSVEFSLCSKLNSSSYRNEITPVLTKVLDIKKKKWSEVIPKEEQDIIFDVLGKLKSIDPEKKWQWPASKIGDRFVIGTIDQFINSRLPDLAFIYDEENGTRWSPINKLDTNYSDAAVLITDIINNSEDFNPQDILDDLNKGDTTKLRSVLNQIEERKDLIYSTYLTIPDLYTQNSLFNSMEGEEVEGFVVKTMLENGWKLVHRGSGGDPIDVLLGVDLIVEKDGEIKTMQCKKVWNISFEQSTLLKPQEGSYRISGKAYVSKQRNLDFVGYGTMSGEVIVAKRQKEVVKIDKGYEYTDKMILPTPVGQSTYFYIDKESVVAKSKNL